jgi:hypothetical protein
MAWLGEMGILEEEILEGNGFFQEEVFSHLRGLNSRELDFVYDVLKARYRKSSTAVSIPLG